MRYSVAAVAPFLAVAAMAEELHTTTVLVGFTGTDGKPTTQTSAYTYDYSNPATAYLTQTNSDGIVTGMPSNTVGTAIPTQPKAETSQPPVATIPAGLGTGAHTLTIPASGSSGLNTFTISVGSSTTQVVGAAPGITGVTTSGGAKPTGSSGSGSGSGSNGGDSSSQTGSDGKAAPSSTGGSGAGHFQAPAAAGVLGALFALLV
ncbi:hypothetical protein PG984_009201 [Apiospora sp. TS-2023a]|uniref:Uncharacterized protein n=1 Tax=Apiospora saccharicola TaxID=335842 RepID=A0ABR1ULR0_9PEZI